MAPPRPLPPRGCGDRVRDITVGFDCPLTNLERWLRRQGGEQSYTGVFIDHYVKGHLYPHGYDLVVQLRSRP